MKQSQQSQQKRPPIRQTIARLWLADAGITDAQVDAEGAATLANGRRLDLTEVTEGAPVGAARDLYVDAAHKLAALPPIVQGRATT